MLKCILFPCSFHSSYSVPHKMNIIINIYIILSYLSLSGLGIVGLEVEEKLGELAGRAGMVEVGRLAGW